MTALSRVVVVGAGVAGVRAVEALRAAGYDGTLTVVDADPELPYDRPALSKEFLTGTLDDDDLQLWSLDRVAVLGIDLRLATSAVGLDPHLKRLTVRCPDGGVDVLHYDRLVLAVGVAARRPVDVAGLDGVHVLKSLVDARAIRDGLRSKPGPVVVIGGGFIGGEVACSAAEYGLDVTVVEAGQRLLPNVLSADLARPLERLHEERGVRLVRGKQVTAVKGVGGIECVELADGTQLAAAMAVLGLGGTPRTAWLERSDIALSGGILVDAQLRTATESVYAIGDAVRWPDNRTGLSVRREHWTCARRQGTHVAQGLMGDASPFHEIPYIWTDQHGGRLQIAGANHGDEVRFVDGGPDECAYVALVRRGDELAGVIALDRVREFNRLRRALSTAPAWDSVIGRGQGSPWTEGSACAS